MAYPATIDTFTPKVDNVDQVVAADINGAYTTLERIQTELGTDPAGSLTDVKTRLAISLTDAGYVRYQASSALTISSGAITASRNVHTVDTEGGAGSDDLDTINGGVAGFVLILRTTASDRDIVVKHGTGNITCAEGADFTLSSISDFAYGYYDGGTSTWYLARSIGGSSVTVSGTTAGQVPFLSAVNILTSDDDLAFSTAAGLIGNESGGTAVDLRWETDNNTHALFVDASADAVYIGGSGSGDWLKANGTAGIIINEASGSAIDFRVESNTYDKMIFMDASGDVVQFGDPTGGNYIQIDGAGTLTMTGTATVFEDLVVPLTSSKIGSNSKPDFDETNVAYLFPQNDTAEVLYFIVQMPHAWKQGSTIYPHVHWFQTQNLAAVFAIDYQWTDVNEAPAGFTTLPLPTYVYSYDTGTLHQISTDTAGIAGTGHTISSILQVKLYRNDNVYTGDASTLQFDIHYERDTLGSNTEYAK